MNETHRVYCKACSYQMDGPKRVVEELRHEFGECPICNESALYSKKLDNNA